MTGILTTPKTGQKVNIWVFVDIFDNFTWTGILVVVSILTIGFLVTISYERGSKQSNMMSVFDGLCLVVFVIVQLGYDEYTVKNEEFIKLIIHIHFISTTDQEDVQ